MNGGSSTRARHNWAYMLVVGLLTGALWVAGCGSSSPTRGADPSGSAPSADPKALGVDSVNWPEDAAAAIALFRAMPKRLAGLPRFIEINRPGSGGDQYLGYGNRRGGVNIIAMAPFGEGPDRPDPNELVAMIGLMYKCRPSTYAGSFPVEHGRVVAEPGDEPGWFRCAARGSEGDPNFRGMVMGWTSRDIVWLLTADNENLARAVVAEMATHI